MIFKSLVPNVLVVTDTPVFVPGHRLGIKPGVSRRNSINPVPVTVQITSLEVTCCLSTDFNGWNSTPELKSWNSLCCRELWNIFCFETKLTKDVGARTWLFQSNQIRIYVFTNSLGNRTDWTKVTRLGFNLKFLIKIDLERFAPAIIKK